MGTVHRDGRCRTRAILGRGFVKFSPFDITAHKRPSQSLFCSGQSGHIGDRGGVSMPCCLCSSPRVLKDLGIRAGEGAVLLGRAGAGEELGAGRISMIANILSNLGEILSRPALPNKVEKLLGTMLSLVLMVKT